MREHPWHLRRATAEHHQWYRNLVDLHALTLSWLQELREQGASLPAHSIRRWGSLASAEEREEIEDTLWMLDSIGASLDKVTDAAGVSLDSLLDDTSPEDLLARLEHTTWAVQASTLAQVLEATPEKDRSAIRNQLEQCSWKQGRRVAASRWPDLDPETRGDLRSMLAAYRDSPLSGWPRHPSWLVERAVPKELRLELTGCAHESRFLEVRQLAQELCPLHSQFTRGYVYELNTRVTIDHAMRAPAAPAGARCRQRWYFL